MSTFSNDPKDVVRSIVKDGLAKVQEQDQPDPSKVLTRETMPGKNPLEHGIRPTSFIIGSVLAFWVNFIRNFWYWLPLMAAIIYYGIPSEEMAKMIEAGGSVASAGAGALWYAMLASVTSLIPTYIVGSRLRRGEVVKRSSVILLTSPSLLLGCLTFYHIAFMIILHLFH